MTQASGALDSAQAFATAYLVPAGLHVAIAIAVFVIGRFVARWLIRGADRVMERGKVDISVRKFLGSVLYAVMFIALTVVALDTVGVRTTAIVALVGAAGITIGLALQGSLSNFAAGVTLIMFRPYKVTDLVVIGKYLGRVDAIKVFNTVLVTPDHREVTLPNALILGGPIENLTVLGRRRIDLLVTIDNNTAPPFGGAAGAGQAVAVAGARAIAELRALLVAAVSDPRVAPDPVVAVEVAEVTHTAVRLRLRLWTTVTDYAPLLAHEMEAIRGALLAEMLHFAISAETPVA